MLDDLMVLELFVRTLRSIFVGERFLITLPVRAYSR